MAAGAMDANREGGGREVRDRGLSSADTLTQFTPREPSRPEGKFPGQNAPEPREPGAYTEPEPRRVEGNRARFDARSMPDSVFDKGSQAFERVVPLLRDVLEITPCFVQPMWVHLPESLSALAFGTNEPRSFQNLQMLGHCLAGNARLVRQPGDR